MEGGLLRRRTDIDTGQEREQRQGRRQEQGRGSGRVMTRNRFHDNFIPLTFKNTINGCSNRAYKLCDFLMMALSPFKETLSVSGR